jgi:hypothetical protein
MLAKQYPLKVSPSQLRPCPKCQSPMLLMTAVPASEPGMITKLYECYVCHSTDTIERTLNVVRWAGSRELQAPT